LPLLSSFLAFSIKETPQEPGTVFSFEKLLSEIKTKILPIGI